MLDGSSNRHYTIYTSVDKSEAIMSTTTIRVSEQTHAKLQALARDVGAPMSDVVDQAIEAYRRQRIIDQANAQYAALRADPEAWAEVEAERAVWDATLMDGLGREGERAPVAAGPARRHP
jgi:predicted transcriptional regulator